MVMKRALLTMLALTLWLAMVSGATISYFTAQYEVDPIPFTTGTVKVHADALSVGGMSSDWAPGLDNALDIAWAFENTGTKTAFLRAKIDTKWTITQEGTVTSPTAWAGLMDAPEGSADYAKPYQHGGNSPRYFKVTSQTPLPKSIVLAAGADQDEVGEATLSKDGTNLYIQLNLDPEWNLRIEDGDYQAHLHISDELDFPNGNGRMNCNDTFVPSSNRFVVPLASVNFDPMYIAIHLGITKTTSSATVELSGDTNTIWTLVGPNWTLGADGWWYHCGIVQPGEVVPLSFQVTLTSLNLDDDMTLRGAEYTADLTVEAIQTTNGSAADQWPLRPTSCIP